MGTFLVHCGGGGNGGGGSAPSGAGAISTAPGGEPSTGAPVSEPSFEPPPSALPPPAEQPVAQPVVAPEPAGTPVPIDEPVVVAAKACVPLKTEEPYMSFPDTSSTIKTVSSVGDVFMVAHYNKIFLWDTDPTYGLTGKHQGWLLPKHPKTGSSLTDGLLRRSYCFDPMSVVVAGLTFETNHMVCAISASYFGLAGNRYLLFDMGVAKGLWGPQWLGGIENMNSNYPLVKFDHQRIMGQNGEPPFFTKVDVVSPRDPYEDYWLVAVPKKPSTGYDAMGDGYKMEKHEPLVVNDISYFGAPVPIVPFLQDGKLHIWRLYETQPGMSKTYRLAFIQSETNARVVSEEFTTADYIERIFRDQDRLYALTRREIVPFDLFWDDTAKTYRMSKQTPIPIGKNESTHKIQYSSFAENVDFSNRTTLVGKYLFTFASVYHSSEYPAWSNSLMVIHLQTGEQIEVLPKIKVLYGYGVEKFHFTAGPRAGMEGIAVWQENDLKLYTYEPTLCP